MADSDFIASLDDAIEDALSWLDDHGGIVFDTIRHALAGVYDAVEWVLLTPPFYVVAVLVLLAGWRIVGARFGLFAALGLLLCAGMDLWAETMETLALVTTAMVFALLFSIPVGILAGYFPRLKRAAEPALDLIQTLPPYLYLLPAIALLGYGPATALAATCIVALPPALRLTALGIGQTPQEFVELGQANGIRPLQMFVKIRLPFAFASIMAGVNQSLMMAFGMVVIAGIVGSGGLGETIYGAIRTLDIGTSIDAAIAMVVLTIVLDRLTQGIAASGRVQ